MLAEKIFILAITTQMDLDRIFSEYKLIHNAMIHTRAEKATEVDFKCWLLLFSYGCLLNNLLNF